MTTERAKKKKTMTTVGYSIPLDLIFEILLKLPSKSVLRFKSVSKSWISIIRSQQFMDAFMSQSLTRPRLLLALEDIQGMLFFSSPHQNSSFLSLSSMLVTEKNSLTMPKFIPCNSVRGFLCCCLCDRSKEYGFVVCNPTTGQVIPLYENNKDGYAWRMFLGYDPNNDQYKVLRLTFTFVKPSGSYVEHSVCTLGGQLSSNSWRPIKTSILYYCFTDNGHGQCRVNIDGVCIDGVVYYYYYERSINHSEKVLISFDVRSEQLRPIEKPEDLSSGSLTNYLGKLAVHSFPYEGFMLWVFDIKNQVWSKKTFVFPIYNEPSILSWMRFGGINAYGEIVYFVEQTFDLFCYDVEKKMAKRIRLEGLSKFHSYSSLFYSYVDNILYL